MPTDETPITALAVNGTVPAALSGQYLRIGHNRLEAVGLHTGSAVSYRTGSIATDASAGATSTIGFGSSILTFGNGKLAGELNADLDTVRPVDLAGAGRRITGNPAVDQFSGELHILTFRREPSQLHVCVSSGGMTRTIRSIDNAPSRIRQLELTRDHVVLLANGFVGVIARTGLDATASWFAVDTDACRMATASAHGETVVVYATGPSLVRWTLHRRAKRVHCEVLDATPQMFAGSNPAANRFLWTVGAGAVHKHDLLAATRQSCDLGGGRNRGELVFIADPGRSRAEDGGWLVGFVHDETHNEADFVVLDAQQIERPAIAVAHIPHHMFDGAHGAWIPATSPI